MYCEHCGKETKKGGKSCEYCGAPLSENKQELSKKLPWKLITLGILALILLLTGIRIRDGKTQTLNPRNYIEVEAIGTSGSGRFYYTFDPEEELFYTLLAAQTKDEKEGLGLLGAAWELENNLEDAIQIDAVFENSENGKLSNGDVVKLVVKVDQKFFKQLGCSFASSQYELKYEIGKDLPALQNP